MKNSSFGNKNLVFKLATFTLFISSFALFNFSCASKKIKTCSEQDLAAGTQILSSAIELKLEKLKGIEPLLEDFRQKKLSQIDFDKAIQRHAKQLHDVNTAGIVAIRNFKADHPECAFDGFENLVK